MASLIEDYALIGDRLTAALVGRDGSIDWLCFPRFDSDACFTALLGSEEHGRWRLAPAGARTCTRRRYRGDTLVLETEWADAGGTVRVIDFMPERNEAPDVVRIVEGVSGRVAMESRLRARFGYGRVEPWWRHDVDETGAAVGIVGPDALTLRGDVRHERVEDVPGSGGEHVARFEVSAGDRVSFVLTWSESFAPPPSPVDAGVALRETEDFWNDWCARCRYDGEWRDAVVRSLLTLKALTYAPTGGIVAAPTTSLPEEIGGVRNWDYRYSWLRDSTFTLQSLVLTGYQEEARQWREWLLRALAGQPEHLQIVYGAGGERDLKEHEVDWLPGYQGSSPVRVGNDAASQFQLDVYGEVVDSLCLSVEHGLPLDKHGWRAQLRMVSFVEQHWQDPDAGLWEMRGDPRHHVHSKVLAWVALDRALRRLPQSPVRDAVPKEQVNRWRQVRDEIHREVCERGWDADRQTFTLAYGERALDAATLLIPQLGFLPPDDPRVVGTVAAVERELVHDGFVWRYNMDGRGGGDALPGHEAAFLPCTLWLADDYHLMGRENEARALLERVLDVRNDVGLLAEEYDPAAGRQLGNFPQAFSHVPVVNTARILSGDSGGPHPHPRASGRGGGGESAEGP